MGSEKEVNMLEKSPLCNSKLMNLQKQRKNSIISKNLLGFRFLKNSLCFLRYQGGFYHITIRRKMEVTHKHTA